MPSAWARPTAAGAASIHSLWLRSWHRTGGEIVDRCGAVNGALALARSQDASGRREGCYGGQHCAAGCGKMGVQFGSP